MGKQRKIKTMRKFLNLTITLMILFISISTVGCGAKDDYIEGYGEDYIEEGEYEYYEEPQETTISDKDMQKILKKNILIGGHNQKNLQEKLFIQVKSIL